MSLLPSFDIYYKTLYERERELSNALLDYRNCWLMEESKQWMPVSSGKLPKECGTVLVYWRELDLDGTPSCAGCDGCGGFIDAADWIPEGKQFLVEGFDYTEMVTHWRPLPAAPNVTSKEGGDA